MSKENKVFNASQKITNIENDVVFEGKMKFQEKLLIKGSLKGSLSSENGEVIIENGGVFDGDLKSRLLENYGVLKGKAIVEQYHVFSSGKSDCDIVTKEITVEKGASISGSLAMDTNE
jgi:cytoskeletal protein CcmA (bactofilin family)